MASDAEKIIQWQQTKDPELFTELVSKYTPMMYKTVNQYKTTGLSKPTLKARAQSEFIKAIDTYKPEFKTQPSTHIFNHLRKIQRAASESLTSGRVPEHRNMKLATYSTAKANLFDELGREPSGVEVAERLRWSPKAVEHMEREVNDEVTASDAEFPFYGNSATFEHKDLANVEYLYHSNVSNPERVVLEHTFGFGGKPVMNNKQIAQKLNMNEMAVSRMKKKLSARIQSMRS